MWRLLVSFAMGLLLCGEAGAQSPTTVAELHDRWIELLRRTDGDISAKTFEKVFGLELLVAMHGADGAIGHNMQVTRLDGASLLASVYTHSGERFTSASLEWTPGYFALLTSRSCIDPVRLAEDLVAMGWRVRPAARRAPAFSVLFQKSDNLAAYGNADDGKGRRCRLYYQSHYFDPGWVDRNRRVPTKEPQGRAIGLSFPAPSSAEVSR